MECLAACGSRHAWAVATFFVLHPGKRGEAVIPNPNPNHPQANAEWVKFTKKWRYNAQQRAAIRVEIAAIFGKE